MATKKPKTSLSPKEVKMWMERINRSRAWRKPEEDKWKKYIRFARGKFFETALDQDQIAVNLVHPHVRIIIPAVYSKNPDIVVVARQKSAVDAAKAMELLLRYLIKEMGLKEEMKSCLLDTLIMGHSWMKVGYQAEFETVESKLPLVAKAFDSLKKMLAGDDATYDQESTYYLQPDERIVEERPWALRVSPFDVHVPSMSSSRYELPWISHQMVRRLSDVKDTPAYKNTAGLRPSASASTIIQNKATGKTKALESPDEFEDYVVLHEIWDCTEGCIYTIAEDNDKCLEVKPNEFSFLDSRHCFEMLGFNFIPDQFYPMSEIEPWEPQLHELNSIRTQQSIHRKRYNRRYVYLEGDFTPEGLEKLTNGEDGATIPTTAEDARTALAPVQDLALPNDVYATEVRIKEDITNIGGITDYQRGSSASGAKTATEASIVESQSRYRSEERLDVVGTFASRIIRNIAMIAQNFMDQDQVFPIMGDEAIYWVKLNKKQIQGEMLFEIVYGSSAPPNRDVEKQQILQFYELAAQDPYYDPVKLRTELLRKYFGIRDPESWMRADVTAMLKEAEMQAIQDAMVAGPAGVGGGTGGKNGSTGTPQAADLMGGVRRSLQTRTPAGVGGGKMTQ